MYLMISLATVTVALSFLIAPTGAVAEPGKSYNAGIRFLATQGSSKEGGSERARITLWHPTPKKEHDVRLGPYSLKVANDATLAPGRFGLIVISHGAGGGRLNHRDTARALARAGWIVAAVHHPGDNWQDGSRTGTAAAWQSRPRDLSAAIDAVLADAVLGAAIDPMRIGAIVSFFMRYGGCEVLSIPGLVFGTRYTVYCPLNAVDVVEKTVIDRQTDN